jgi:hypothetical protein
MPRLPADTSSVERLARLEQQMEHVVATVDKVSKRQDEIHAAMLQAQGAAWFGRWLLPGATGVIGFVASKLGTGAVHLP